MSHPVPSSLEVRLFGPPIFLQGGEPLPRLRSRKGHWLLALLALRAGREAGGPLPVERDWLVATLWPESGERRARTSLRVSLADLRRALGRDAWRLGAPSPYSLCFDPQGAEVDVLAFDAEIAAGGPADLERAVARYRGPLLEGCAEEWAFQERQPREQGYLAALEHLAAGATAVGDPATAEQHLRRSVATDPLRETAHRALMQALASQGRFAAAIPLYRDLRLLLHRELNTEPDPETRDLFRQLQAGTRQKAALGSGLWALKDGGVPSGPRTAAVLAQSAEPRAQSGSEATLTFLFTDVEGSTRLWEQHPDAMRETLVRHDTRLRQAIEAHGGRVFKTMGDQFCAAFVAAPDALAASLAAQLALREIDLPEPIRIRMALHTGTVEERDGDYFGPPLNRLARLLDTGHGGQILLSLATVEMVRDQLPQGADLRDLGEHRLPDLTRPERIFQLVSPDLPATFPPLRSLEVFPHNLPLQLTRFIGREQQIAAVTALLGDSSPLVTLTGAGGCGKTRLAFQLAAALLREYADGVWLVELAALADATLIPQNVAAALGVREQPGRPLTETLAEHLRPLQLLLVLDNCEHLVADCAALAERLLQQCPHIRILATSREPLGISGETRYRVPPLSLPTAEPTTLLQSEAAQLFLDRAVAARPSFQVTPENALLIAQVCVQLDGMPLAIELAASRVSGMSLERLAERLEERFRLLRGGSRTALPRHQTLRALIDWSYDLLTEPERALLRRLSVFAGGWTLEAAEVICSDARFGVRELAPALPPTGETGAVSVSRTSQSGGKPPHSKVVADDVLDLLTSLVDKSLVQYEEAGGEERYRLLETVRQYGQERLMEAGETERVREGHLEFYLGLAEATEPLLTTAEQGIWLDRLDREHDNMRAALNWAMAIERTERAPRLASALHWFWYLRGFRQEGWEYLTRALGMAGATSPGVRAKALSAAGSLAIDLGEHGPARALLEESLTLGRTLDNRRDLAFTLHCLGRLANDQGDFETARALFTECLLIRREAGVGSLRDTAIALNNLGVAAFRQSDFAAARAYLEESLELARASGVGQAIALALGNLGRVRRMEGDFAAARACLEECLTVARALGQPREMADALYNMGTLACSQGDYSAARSRCAGALAIFRKLGMKAAFAQSLEGLAWAEGGQGEYLLSARLFGAAEALREKGSLFPLPAAEQLQYESCLSAARRALGDAEFAAAWAEGREMTWQEACDLALQDEAVASGGAGESETNRAV